MASQYSEDIGFIKASVQAMHEDIGEIKMVQIKQQGCIDTLLADAAFRSKMRIGMKTFMFLIIATITLRFGDITRLFH